MDFEASRIKQAMDPKVEGEESGFVFVCVDENAKSEGVELPLEEDGTMLVSVLQSQFNGASGLKYRQDLEYHKKQGVKWHKWL